MSEQLPTTESPRKIFVMRIVQDPVKFLSEETNFNKGCRVAINFLRKIKAEIQADDSYSINEPDSDYKKFHTYGNAHLEHYEGLFEILKRSGYSQIDVQSALMDDLPQESDGVSQGEQVKKFIKITEEALNSVYATK